MEASGGLRQFAGRLASLLAVGLFAFSALNCGESAAPEVGRNIQPADFTNAKPSEAAFKRRIESICKRVDQEIAEFEGPPPNVGTIKGMAAMARSGLEGMHAPPGIAAEYSSFVRALDLREPSRGGMYAELPRDEHMKYVRQYQEYTAQALEAARRLDLQGCPYR
ncbi:MAG TPA: hypothetical protein VMS60_06945 [Solirubrobacterales bacterium]|nr:hypothetical protein [Solirubrobacterales bacterium]